MDKSIKSKSKKKHSNSQQHQDLNKSIISSYYVSNPNFLDIMIYLENMFMISLKNSFFI